jgi:hypothetical protein
VLHVVSAFALGHSTTLALATFGVVHAPSRLVESLIALSILVSAVHALRPLVPRGEVAIAAGFGLVHGLAFAGILTGLGLDGSASVPALLAFNVGVELAQLLTVALLFPSLYLASRTRWYPALRIAGAVAALAAATGWVLDRLGVLANPLAGVEEAVIGHPWSVVTGLALAAAGCWLVDRRSATATGPGQEAIAPADGRGLPWVRR